MRRTKSDDGQKLIGPFRKFEVEQIRKIMDGTGRDAVSAVNLAVDYYNSAHETRGESHEDASTDTA